MGIIMPMIIRNNIKGRALLCLLCLSFILAACQSAATDIPTTPEGTTAQDPIVVAVTDTPSPDPTSTAIPVAATVNGEAIPLSYYENEVKRYKASIAEGTEMPSDEEISQTVMDYLVEQELLAQAAKQAGFSFSDEDLEEQIANLLGQLGSGSALSNWMASNFYDDAEFRYALRLSSEAAWQRDQIIATVPDAVEQVRARQIFAQTQAGAERALTSLASGTSFDDLAWEFSPETGGELGWFPRGYLLFPEIEDAAFSLPVGEYSGIIQTEIGYHIILVMEHEEAHPLTTDAKVTLQSQALSQWLENQRTQAVIETQIP